MRAVVGGFAAAVVALLAGAATAQPEKLNQTLNVYEAIVTYPGPIWYESGNPIDASEHYRQQNGPEFVIEQIPKGQKFETWTSMYAVRGYYLAARPDLTIDEFLGANLLIPYEQTCGRENIAIRVLERLPDRIMLLFLCQNSAGGPAGIGYRDGIGELAVYKAFKLKTTFVEVFQKWRGPRFVAGDNTTWPATVADVNHVIELIKTAAVHPSPRQP